MGKKAAKKKAKAKAPAARPPGVSPLRVTEILEAGEAAERNRYRVELLRLDEIGENRRIYPSAMFANRHQLYEGAQAYLDHDYGKQGRSVRDLVGYYENVSPDGSADLVVVNHRDVIHPLVVEQQRSGKPLLGLSHHIQALTKSGRGDDGRPVTIVEDIRAVRSTDLVTQPGAGGQIGDILEEVEMDLERLKGEHAELLEEYKAEVAGELTEELRKEVTDELREQLRNEVEQKLYGSKDKRKQAEKTFEQKLDELREAIESRDSQIGELVQQRETAMREKLVAEKVAGSGLPSSAAPRIASRLAETYESDGKLDAAIDAAIKDEKAYAATIRESVRPFARAGSSRDTTVTIMEEAKSALAGMFGREEAEGEEGKKEEANK